jgi:hypothetical protein
MTTERSHNPMLWSSVVIAVLLAATALAGIYWPATYARETPYSRAGAVGSDLVDVLLVVPVLLISGIRGYRGSIGARLVWLGTQGYLLYNFVIYAFGVHFNALFLVYAATLSVCFYATIFSVRFIPLEQIAQTYGARAPRKTLAIVFVVLAISTAAFDLREDIPAILSGRVLQSAVDLNVPVNFVHVLDLAFLLPALGVCASLLWRRKASGYALVAVCLTVLAIMSVELAAIVAVMGFRGFGPNVPMIVSFAVLGAVFTALLGFYLALGKRAAHAEEVKELETTVIGD